MEAKECRNCENLRLIGKNYACHQLGWRVDEDQYTKWYRVKTVLENRPPVKHIGARCYKFKEHQDG